MYTFVRAFSLQFYFFVQCKCARGPPGPSGPRGPPGAEMTEAHLMAKFRALIRGAWYKLLHDDHIFFIAVLSSPFTLLYRVNKRASGVLDLNLNFRHNSTATSICLHLVWSSVVQFFNSGPSILNKVFKRLFCSCAYSYFLLLCYCALLIKAQMSSYSWEKKKKLCKTCNTYIVLYKIQ